MGSFRDYGSVSWSWDSDHESWGCPSCLSWDSKDEYSDKCFFFCGGKRERDILRSVK